MELLNERSLVDLYTSAVRAFPLTTLRQHATQPIKVVNLEWTPWVGMKTLFVKAIAQNEGKEYNPIVLLKQVNYDGTEVSLTASDGLEYHFDALLIGENDASVRCNCPDFRWRFSYYNSLDKSLYGRKPPKYTRVEGSNRPPANPLELPGMCKHTIKLIHVLQEAGIFKQ